MGVQDSFRHSDGDDGTERIRWSRTFGVSPEIVSKFFGTCCVRDIPMAYLLKLSEPLESMTIPYGDHKEWLVVKVGQHGKEERKTGVVGRLKGHRQEFKEFKDSMEYMHFVFVDPMYVSDVETRIKEYFSEFKLDYGNKSEVSINQNWKR